MPIDVATQVLGFSSRFQDTRLEAVGWLCSKVESIRTTQQGNFSIFWWQKSHETSLTAWNHVSIWCIYSIWHPYILRIPWPIWPPILLTCIPIKSTSQDSSSSLDALLCRVLWTLYGFSLEFIFVSFLFAVCRSVGSFVPEVMLAKGNARFVAQVFCTWRPEAKFQWNLLLAYQILAKELDDVIVHCQISFGHVSFGLVLWGQLWIAGALGMQVFLSGHTPRDVWLAGNAAQGLCRSQCLLEQYACWLVEHFRNPMSLQKCFTSMSFWHFIATMALAAWWVLGRLAGSWKVPA